MKVYIVIQKLHPDSENAYLTTWAFSTLEKAEAWIEQKVSWDSWYKNRYLIKVETVQ